MSRVQGVMRVRAGAVTVVAIAACAAAALGSSRAARVVSPAVQIVRVPHGGIQPEAVRDAAGTLHVLYFSGEPASGNLLYVRSRDEGGSFSEPVRVNSLDGSAIATGTIRGGHIAVGRDGRVHVAWNGSQTALPKGPVDPQTGKAGPAMLYARSNAGGTAFEPQRSVMQRSLTLDGGGTVSADPGGNVYVAWHGNDAKTGNGGEANRRIWIARSSDDGRTFATETEAWREPTGACSCCGMRLLATRGRGLNLLYRSATGNINRDIYLLSSGDRGRTFRGARIHQWEIAACPMTSMDLAEASGGVLAAWESEGQVFFGAVDTVSPGMSWKAAPASDVTGRKHPRLATGPGGQTLLVWTEGTAWARGGSLAWQIFNSKGEAIGPIERRSGMPTWSFGAAVPRGDGGFTVLY